MKTVFGFGLIIFAGFLLLQNIMSLYFHLTMTVYYSEEIMLHALFINAAQMTALAVLAYITWRN